MKLTGRAIEFIKRKDKLAIVIVLGLLFFLIFNFLNFKGITKFTSPDETANFFFAQNFYENSSLVKKESLNQFSENIVHPRSTRVIEENIVPASFIGLPLLYGSLAKIFGPNSILFFTSLTSFFGVIFFFLLIRKIFSEKIALISSILFLIMPVYWFYSTRGLWHNAAFLNILIIAFYFLYKVYKEKKLLNYLLFGIFISLSLAFRTSEIIWIGIVILFFLILNRKRIRFNYILLSFFVFLVLILPIFYYQNQIFGSPLASGYNPGISGGEGGDSFSLLSSLKRLFFPFGFFPDRFLSNFYHYIILFFSFLSLPLILGLIVYLKERKNGLNERKTLFYFFSFIFITFFLMVYYGSFEFYEYIDRTKVILGSSYLRYWLPILIFGLPFVSLFILYLKKILKGLCLTKAVMILAGVIIVFISFQVSLLDELYGVKKLYLEDLKDYEIKLESLLTETESNSLILAGRRDKNYFPQRRVIGYNEISSEILSNLATLYGQVKIYYVKASDIELNYINYLLKERNLVFEFKKSLEDDNQLYELRST